MNHPHPQARRGFSLRFILLAGLAVLPATARAQTPTPTPTQIAAATPMQRVTVMGSTLPASEGSAIPGQTPNTISPRIAPGVIAPSREAEHPTNGLLTAVTRPLADRGITFKGLVLDAFVDNLSAGSDIGQRLNNGIAMLDTDIDTERLLGLRGGAFHMEESLFFLRNNENISPQIGDNTLGYQPPHLFRGNYLSVMTYEQKLFGHVDAEIGRSNLTRYFLVPNCDQMLTCFKDSIAMNAGISTPIFSSWMGRAAFTLANGVFFQFGAQESNAKLIHTDGWRWDTHNATGAVGMGEIGYKRGFDKTAYPSTFEFAGYYNSSTITDPLLTVRGTSRVANPRLRPATETGVSGVFLTGQQYVWRKDGGRTRNPHGTAVAVYGGAGSGFETYDAIKAEAYLGAKIQAPFAGHPNDTYNMQIHWSTLGSRQKRFLAESSQAAGYGYRVPSDAKMVFDLHSHTFVLPSIALEPSVQYIVNPNNYYAPRARPSRDGFEIGMTAIIYLRPLLGLAHP